MGDNVKKCSNCGEILSKDDIYCPKCGSKYEEISNKNKTDLLLKMWKSIRK